VEVTADIAKELTVFSCRQRTQRISRYVLYTSAYCTFFFNLPCPSTADLKSSCGEYVHSSLRQTESVVWSQLRHCHFLSQPLLLFRSRTGPYEGEINVAAVPVSNKKPVTTILTRLCLRTAVEYANLSL
jgi:hypothetical protein